MKGSTAIGIGLLVIAGSSAAELLLRNAGLRSIPLFQSDQRYEYFTAPLQSLQIGAVRFTTNEQGMRNGPIAQKKGRRVLVMGDSVINGGYSVDQDSLATELANAKARQQGVAIEFINLSANSWGAGNVAAFLEAHGTFDADEVIAVFSSHDACDRMTFDAVVGVHPSFPAEQPCLALGAALHRATYRPGALGTTAPAPCFDPGWQQLRSILKKHELPITVLLHPELNEIESGTYNAGGQQLLDTLRSWNFRTTPMLHLMHSSMYTDGIHLNAQGHAVLAGALWDQTLSSE